MIDTARKVSIALKSKLKHKLESLENLSIIIKRVEKPTEWVQSLVIDSAQK